MCLFSTYSLSFILLLLIWLLNRFSSFSFGLGVILYPSICRSHRVFWSQLMHTWVPIKAMLMPFFLSFSFSILHFLLSFLHFFFLFVFGKHLVLISFLYGV